ncbi:MAG: hypothetical protein IKW83_12165 [Muribaculaceae bacterium]|nr:hypothetical protein [Muribaculaceae bacterium]
MNDDFNLNEAKKEEAFGLTERIVRSWIDAQGLSPAPPENIAAGRTMVRSTDNICDELADIADLDPNDVASVMLRMGFNLTFPNNGRHGWVMYLQQ